jgi:hypothetical protein
MYQPLEHVTINEAHPRWSGWRCRIPHCWGEDVGHGLCQFHHELARRQYGEVCFYPDDLTTEEKHAYYSAHAAREVKRIPYHLIMALLWPGPNAEQRAKNDRREKSLKQRWQEEGDR